MITTEKKAYFAYIIAFFLSILSPLGINFFSCALVMLLYTVRLSRLLFLTVIAGLYLDCITISPRFGLIALSFLFAVRILYPYRLYFFKDAGSTLAIMCYFCSFLSKVITFTLASFLDLEMPKHQLSWYLTQCFIEPVFDSLYAVLCFGLLPYCLQQGVRR